MAKSLTANSKIKIRKRRQIIPGGGFITEAVTPCGRHGLPEIQSELRHRAVRYRDSGFHGIEDLLDWMQREVDCDLDSALCVLIEGYEET